MPCRGRVYLVIKNYINIINCLDTLSCIIIGSTENATRLWLKICAQLKLRSDWNLFIKGVKTKYVLY
jgi:hypothetical protein